MNSRHNWHNTDDNPDDLAYIRWLKSTQVEQVELTSAQEKRIDKVYMDLFERMEDEREQHKMVEGFDY
jgi:hypothetical protein